MKSLLDENVSLRLASVLREGGHSVTAVAETAERGLEDTDVWKLAQASSSVLITQECHFTNHTRFDTSTVGGIIYIRPGNLSSREESELVAKFVSRYSVEQYARTLVTLSRGGIRVR